MNEKLRIFLVLDETHFFHPEFVSALLKQTRDDIVGCARVVEIAPKNNIDLYLKKHWTYLKFWEIFALGFRFLSRVGQSVGSVLRENKIPFFDVKVNINTPDTLNRIRDFQPDVIVSSNSLYFGQEILSLPRRGCLNRHSGLLPSYGGLWPVFHAVRRGEPNVGVSVHVMTPQIDKGAVLSQIKIPVDSKTIYELYDQCFQASVDAVLKSLNKVRESNFSSEADSSSEPSYFSFPTSDDWKEFRRRGGRFI